MKIRALVTIEFDTDNYADEGLEAAETQKQLVHAMLVGDADMGTIAKIEVETV